MMIKRTSKMISTLLLFYSVSAVSYAAPVENEDDAWGYLFGPGIHQQEVKDHHVSAAKNSVSRLVNWNRIAVDSSGIDHTPVAIGENRTFGEQLGPGRSSRAMAIVHMAVFEAVNAIVGDYKSYIGLEEVAHGKDSTSVDAAIAQAAHDTLIALFPSQKPRLDNALNNDLNQIPDGDDHQKEQGIQLGSQAAAMTLALKENDGSFHKEPLVGIDFITSTDPGKWRQDPISQVPIAMGAYWGKVKPFVLKSGDQFRIPPPPSLDSPEYAAAFNEVKQLGGDGVHTPTVRTQEQAEIGTFWAYDGTPSLCAPPRLYNQIIVQIALKQHTRLLEFARLLALENVAMADEGVANWDSKYFYQFWRPISGITLANGNNATTADPGFMPLGAPASNKTGPNFTPPFPAYPSGHAGFGGAIFQTLRNFYKTDRIPFTFVSDELNGVTKGNDGNARPLKPRSFSTLSQAEEENGQSRIYLGIHWSFDKTEGIAQGRKVANYIFKNLYAHHRE